MGEFCEKAQLVESLRYATQLILLTHNDPDGDALGSQLALARGLKLLNKQVRLINIGRLQPYYEWLLQEGEAEFYPRSGPFPTSLEGDLIVGLDFNGWERLLGFESVVVNSGISTAVIDHHPAQKASADYTFVDTTASSTGLLVWEILRELGVSFDLSIADPTYVSLITDTGHFRFSNTDKRAHELAGSLIDLGVNPPKVYRKIFESSSLARLRLLGQALTQIQTRLDDRIVWVAISKEQMDACDTRPEETEGFMDVMRTMDAMDVCLLFRETDNDQVKVSLRSRESFNVSNFATKLGGGGHPKAAGITFDDSLEDVVDQVISALEKELA